LQDNEKDTTYRDILYILFKYKYFLLVFIASALTATIIYSYSFLPRYEASSKILIRISGEKTSQSTGITSPSMTIPPVQYDEIINSEIELITGRLIAEQVVRTLGPETFRPQGEKPSTLWGRIKSYLKATVSAVVDSVDTLLSRLGLKKKLSPEEKLISAVADGLEANVIKNSNSVRIKFRSPSPELAARVVNTAVDQYMKHRLSIYMPSNALNFFSSQEDASRIKLQESENKLKKFKEKWDISSIEEQRSHLLKLNADIRSEMDKTDIELSMLREKVTGTDALLKERAVAFPDNILTNPNKVVESLKLKLIDLKISRSSLYLKYAKDSPLIRSIDDEIESVERVLKAEEAGSAVSVDIEAAEAKRKTLTSLLEKLNGELNQLNDLEFTMRELDRDVQQNERLYRTYAERTEETRIFEAMDMAQITNIRVIEQAFPPLLPVRTLSFLPQRMFNIIMALIVSAFLGISAVAFLEKFDYSYKSVDDVEEDLGLPVLGTIPNDTKIRKGTGAASLIGKYSELSDLSDGLASDFRTLKNNIDFVLTNEGPVKSVLVAASRQMEGCSYVARNLALILAEEPSLKVLLLDLSFAAPGDDREAPRGLADCVMSGVSCESVTLDTSVANVKILPFGKAECNPLYIIKSDEFTRVLEGVKKEYSFIIIDAPPLQHYPEATLLASKVDGVLLVIRSEKTNRQVVMDTKKKLEAAHARILGVVMNRKKYYIPGSIYARL
jgi:succinoglycan biosynthesis transport protein ExoP